MKCSLYERAFERLPEYFRKPENKKLYYIGYGNMGALYTEVEKIRDARDIDKAEGNSLDLIGQNVGQGRENQMDDEEYRIWIKSKIVANNSRGDIPTINEVASQLFGSAYLGAEELWKKDGEPAAVVIYLKPKIRRFPQKTINRMVAGGVEIYWVLVIEQEQPSLFLYAFTKHRERITIFPEKLEKHVPDVYLYPGSVSGAGGAYTEYKEVKEE